MRYRIYRTKAKVWRWRLRGANNEILASGEAFTSRPKCLHSVKLVRGKNTHIPIEVLTKGFSA
jgi:uncharacterized protein YegP (UPF0339 family)